MTVTTVLVTHPGIATAMAACASTLLGTQLENIVIAEVDSVDNNAAANIQKVMDSCSSSADLLILTDLPGATPCNLARRAAPPDSIIVSGLNLPMLIRAWNYRELELHKLAELVIEGAKSAILESD